jgi:Uncharacterised nucleotidyltransferase
VKRDEFVRGSVVKRTRPEEIVGFLSFSSSDDSIDAFKEFTLRDWKKVLHWMDDAGISFYFLQKLKDTNATDLIPSEVLARLETNFSANKERVEDMSCRFDALNREFNNAGVHYAALKGISLVPEFCPYAPLRHQGDFDYLVDARSLEAAQRIVAEAGYVPKEQRSVQEFIYVMPGAAAPSRSGEKYSARAPHAVELHLDIWDENLHGMPSIPNLISVERARLQEWNGSAFPALSDEDAFLLQILHACQHLFTHWIRMSCFLEIGYFLNRRTDDIALWNRVEQRVGDNPLLREFVVVVCGMVDKLFSPTLPQLIRDWSTQTRPAPRVWIEKYARHWAFCEIPVYQFSLFPRYKLVDFLQSQYRGTAPAAKSRLEKGALQKGVPPSSRLSRIASSLSQDPSLALNAAWWKRQLLVRRGIFHALAELRYLYEIPRWLWLTRAIRSVPLDR